MSPEPALACANGRHICSETTNQHNLQPKAAEAHAQGIANKLEGIKGAESGAFFTRSLSVVIPLKCAISSSTIPVNSNTDWG